MGSIDEEKIEDILSDDLDIEYLESIKENKKKNPLAVYYINSGEALDSKEVYEIAAKEKTKLIVLAGLAGSGKTTIETSLYQIFQKNTVGGFYFAGSNTIQGYEQRSFYTRTKSRGIEPTTQRTSLETSRSFLHLRLWEKEMDKFCNFLFADLSGEAFESHIGRVNDVKKDYSFMERADYFVGVLDGELLNDKRKRNSTIAGLNELIRTFYDAEVIGKECTLQIVFSKCDVFIDDDSAEKILQKAEQNICQRFQNIFCNINFFKVAAMPKKSGKYEVGYGIEDLVISWTKKSVEIKDKTYIEKTNILSEFDKLSYKMLEV